MVRYERPVRFEDVDAAGIVFFARILGYCHEAMEALFSPLEGGYVRLITERRLGLPTVHVETDFTAPLRYGDTARIDVTAPHVGTTSCTLAYTVTRARDGTRVAKAKHVCVVSDLDALTKRPIPADVRAVLEANRV
jgi:4-hydroxybenzoyl-CoA thioesterase